MYNLIDLLRLLATESAEELRLAPDEPPRMLLHGKVRVLDAPLLTHEQVSELFRGIATDEQRRELELCGDARFQYATEHCRFYVQAGIHAKLLTLTIRNLAR